MYYVLVCIYNPFLDYKYHFCEAHKCSQLSNIWWMSNSVSWHFCLAKRRLLIKTIETILNWVSTVMSFKSASFYLALRLKLLYHNPEWREADLELTNKLWGSLKLSRPKPLLTAFDIRNRLETKETGDLWFVNKFWGKNHHLYWGWFCQLFLYLCSYRYFSIKPNQDRMFWEAEGALHRLRFR